MVTADTTDILTDGTSGAVTTLPDPCYISIAGVAQKVVGGIYTYKTTRSGVTLINLVGKYQGQIKIISHKLAQLKRGINDEINRQYLDVLHGGFTYANNVYDSDETSMNMISGAASEAGRSPLPAGFAWKTTDNQFVPMAKADIEGLAASMFVHINTVFALKENKKATLSALTGLADILNFNTKTGWI